MVYRLNGQQTFQPNDFDQVAFNRGRILPSGWTYFENIDQYQNHNKWSDMGKLDMLYH